MPHLQFYTKGIMIICGIMQRFLKGETKRLKIVLMQLS
jgi:hypothetical protein